jgi:serine/threonine-protein kinase
MIGSRLGRWLVDGVLGAGGMGDVYLGHQVEAEEGAEEEIGRQGALKVLGAELSRDVGLVERFNREIAILRLLSHPNIVAFYESGKERDYHFYAMEYIEGRTYEQLLNDQGRIPIKDVVDMAIQICPALKHAHDRGIIHRDIKPSNLMRSTTGSVKLTDFGIAKIFATTHLTRTGGVVGTAEFLSPEQAVGKPATKRSDLYSFGIVLYTLVTGRPPFRGNSVADLLHKHCYGQFDAPIKIVPEMPYELNETVCQLLEKDPARRPADAIVLQRRLDAVRRRLGVRERATVAIDMDGVTTAENAERGTVAEGGGHGGPGPATLVSQFVREELHRQRVGGQFRQFINRPVVLILLLLLCVGLGAWVFWPASAESLFRSGSRLMASEDMGDWQRAWEDYFVPLNEKYPGHPYREQVEEFRTRLEEAQLEKKASRAARKNEPASEAQWFYNEGVRLHRQGKQADARRVWQNVAVSFQGVASEEVWVALARQALDKPPSSPAEEKRWGGPQAALEQARKLCDEGKRVQAEEIWRGLEDLYKDDPSAQGLLKELREDRGR